MAYTFPPSFTASSFVNDYIYKRIILYPIVILAAAVLVILLVRTRAESLVRSYIGHKPKYYDRIHYLTIKVLFYFSIATIGVVVIIGIALNADLTTKLDNVVTQAFGAIKHTSDIVLSIEDNLSSLNQTLNIGFNGTEFARSSQDQIIEEIGKIQTDIDGLTSSLSYFSNNFISTASSLSYQARELILSLKKYPQLTGVPSVEEVPGINATQTNAIFQDAFYGLSYASGQLDNMRTTVMDLNINVNISGASIKVQGVVSDLDTVSKDILSFNNQTDQIKSYADKYNAIRMGVLFTTYVIPLMAASLGILGIQIRATNVVRVWYHLLLVGASLCSIFAAIYMAVPVMISDVCNTPQTAIFTGINSIDPEAYNTSWYKNLYEYLPVFSKCTDQMYFIDYVDLPPEVNNLLNQSAMIETQLNFNYTTQINDATSELDQGINSLDRVNISLLNSTATLEKLDSISVQLKNLTQFGFSMTQYNASIDEVNDLTKHIVATFPNNQSTVTYSIYYTAANMSKLELDKYPYTDTTTEYRNELSGKLTAFNELDRHYHQILDLTAQIGQNVTSLRNMIVQLAASEKNFTLLEQEARETDAQIHVYANNITQIVNNLKTLITNDVLPQLNPITNLWNNVTQLTKCGYVGDLYRSAEDLVCVTAQVSAVGYVTTQLVAAGILCVLNFGAIAAWISFKRPYKPFYDESKETLLPATVRMKPPRSPKPPPPEEPKETKETKEPKEPKPRKPKQKKKFVELV